MICYLLFVSCQAKVPIIYSISPQIGNIGEPLTIRGANFGRDRDVSYVTIAGAQPTGTSYLDWQDNEIIIRIPEFSEAGLVYAHVKGKKSNGMLYANHATLPVQTVETLGGQGTPRIISITPQTGTIGSLVSITGTGFGNNRGKGGVFFSWNARKSATAPTEAMVQEYIEASQSDFGIELWSEREIRVNVPDGAVSGNVEIKTPKGVSPPLSIDLSNRPGDKTFHDKRNYIASVSVNVQTRAAEIPNTLYLWVPRPAASPAQRNTEMLSSNMEPFIDNYKGASLFKLDNIAGETRLNLTWKVDVYSIETLIRPQSIRQEANSPARDAFTRSEAQLPADSSRIKTQVTALAGRESNPYIKAQRIYEWMLREFDFQTPDSKGDVFTALEKKQADSYTAAMLYCTLLRCAGIPCLPIAGVLVSRDQQTMNHWWAEFWIDGFGWVPVDVVMGSGAIPAQFGDNPNKAGYYFGNIDSRRIAFSRGIPNLTQMDPRGRTITHNRSYSLQNLWEEAVGGLDSYTSLWGDVTITGMYSQ
ncbi:MAG: IPT/TIG domain-containing protein [Treponema sp.]|nr:IPT/TIG domain-containing protein [Treponema sp.]